MAKIGNETRLVLKLAKERADKEADQERADAGNDHQLIEGSRSFAKGIEAYDAILRSIVLELEEGVR